MGSISQRFASLSPLKQALLALEEMELRLAKAENGQRESIAIVGMGCRFPGAADPSAFWRSLAAGTDSVREIPAERWRFEEYSDSNQDAPGKMSNRWAAVLDQIDRFDPDFFGIAPREAVAMDPQQRLLLEVAWEALENAGQNPRALSLGQTGVFVGMTGDEYAQIFYRAGDRSLFDAYFASGIARSVAAGRISYTLGLQGPTLSIDTACSSSLVAIHTACMHLRMGECRTALAGGVNIILAPEIGLSFSRAGMLAADGRCKSFDARADGFVRGEGCGIVVLKRLSDAVADGDNVLAVIRGSAVNQDGRSAGLTVPNGLAQEALLRQALANGGVRAEEIGYVEAHGTGTSLGDPIEAHALAAVLGKGRSAKDPLVVGSVKTNVGHLEAAAGVAGLIKVVLSLQQEWIPRHLHFEEMNPHIDWGGVAVEIPVQGREWKRGERRRLAGVSAFGFSGTNAHVIVEEAPEREPRKREIERPLHILALSARDEKALEELTKRYEEELGRTKEELGDVCYTANAGRTHFSQRRVVVGATAEELRNKLAEGLAGVPVKERGGIRPVFLFTGQGSQYAGMGKQLYETQEVFRKAIEECAKRLKGELEEPLEEVLWGAKTELLERTRYTQPGLFAVEWALAELWRSWGIEPGVVLGHSVGEYVAACVAGVCSLEDGIGLIAARGRLMDKVGGRGAMTAVMAGEERVREALKGLEDRVGIAGINARESVVISGYEDGVREAEKRLTGVRMERLRVSHGFHSPQMREMVEEFTREAGKVKWDRGRIKLVSSMTGMQEEITAEYWGRQVVEPVRYGAAIEELSRQGQKVYVEIGPGTTLLGLGKQSEQGEDVQWLASMRRGKGEWEQILESLGRLYERGAEVNWSGFDEPYHRRRVPLPTYPFQRQRYWLEPRASESIFASAEASVGHPLLGRRLEMASSPDVEFWEQQISVRRLPYLADHRAFGTTIFPLTGFLEMMTAALSSASADGARLSESVALCDVVLYEPLVLPTDGAVTVQVSIRNGVVELHSHGEKSWNLHTSARIAPDLAPAGSATLSAVRDRMTRNMTAEQFYETVALRGMDFGPAFCCVQCVSKGHGESLVAIVGHEGDAAQYTLHPALFDGCLQAVAALLPDGNHSLYLPVGIKTVQFFRAAASPLWAHARMAPAVANVPGLLAFDLTIFDEGGPVAELRELQMRIATSEALLRQTRIGGENSLFELRWQSSPVPKSIAAPSGDWLLISDEGSVSARAAEKLRAVGARCTLVDKSTPLAALGHTAWQGVIQFRALDATPTISLTAAAIAQSQELSCKSTLELIQFLASRPSKTAPRLILVTCGAQSVGANDRATSITQSLLWGLAQTIAEEFPEYRCSCVDLDAAEPAESVRQLFAEISAGDSDEQVVFRHRQRYVAKLFAKPMQSGLDRPQRLTIASRGVLDNLQLQPASRRAVPPGHVEIQVDGAGLNFRDVLSALGMYPGDTGALGSECAGHITALGEGVGNFRIGDDVIAMALDGGQDGFVVADQRLVALQPANLTPEQSATLPTAFLTVRYALERLAHLRAGDRILIHAATGGVGLAAVQIAQRAHAEIFATAGSERKRSYLRSLGITHVFNSRTTDFAREISGLTEGRGVDVVLNSLTGEFMAATFAVTAPGGRFIELGKRDIWTHSQVDRLGKNLAYHIVDLAVVARESPALLGDLLRDTVAAVEHGQLKPLPAEIFSFRDAASAYRHMAQAAHVGKIVLRQSTCGARVSSHATYLIAGGFGAVGSCLARWLVQRGARNVVLVGRHGANSQSLSQFMEFAAWAKQQGAQIAERQCDLSRREEMAALFAEIAVSMPPLRGVIHAAGVLDDGVLLQQEWSRFERVLAPKVSGAWILHELTRSLPLDFFILCSSIASILGAPGQASYAAANAFEDALAHERRSHGLAATSINWGAWSMGMALVPAVRARHREAGLAPFSAADGLALLDYILLDNPVQVAAGSINWDAFLRRYSGRPVPKRFSTIASPARASARKDLPAASLREQLERAPESSRTGMLRDHIHSLALRVLGFSADRHLDGQQPLSDLGLDSLMSIEFRNALSSLLGSTLPSTVLFSHPNVDSLTGFAAALLFGARAEPDFAAKPAISPATLLENVEELSDAEIDRLLGKNSEKVP